MPSSLSVNNYLLEWARWEQSGGSVVPRASGESIEYRLMREGAGAAKQASHSPVIYRNELAEAIDSFIAKMPAKVQMAIKCEYLWCKTIREGKALARCGEDTYLSILRAAENDVDEFAYNFNLMKGS